MNLKRKRIRILFALLIAGLFIFPMQSTALTVEERVTHCRLDTGVIFLWKSASGAWQNGLFPGGTHTFNTQFQVGKGMDNVKVYPYNPSAPAGIQGYFDFAGSLYHWNKTKAANSKGLYDDNYFTFRANPLSVNGGETYSKISGNMTVSYQVTFNAQGGERYDIKRKLASPGGKQEVLDLLGEPSQEIIDKMNLLDPSSESYSASVEGYLFFLPIIIQYDEVTEVEIGEFAARLTLPESAKVGEEYVAEDSSILSSDLMIDTATLEKHYGDGVWKNVAVWRGKQVGKNTGESIREVEDAECTVTYRLTVKTNDGRTDSDTKKIQILDSADVNAVAILELPPFTYEGHPVLAEDVSEFTVNGVAYSARRAYEEGFASNSFAAVPTNAGSAVRIAKTEAEMTFPKRGNYEGRLIVNPFGGQRLTDIKPIEVRKTPYILDTLSGFQKQNRMQILNISVATYPDKPIVDYSIEIKDLKTGKSVKLTEQNPQQNNVTIKTRSVTKSGNEYFTNFEVLFLTKTPEYDPFDDEHAQDFSYDIYVRDSKGDTDMANKTFAVIPDSPPKPEIGIDPSFLREKETNIAKISMEDMTVASDGDEVVRTWFFAEGEQEANTRVDTLSGYEEQSFGTDKKVGFDKTGVGGFNVGLFVKEKWTEPTLEEYVTDSDYLTGSAVETSFVDNVAPVVSLELLPSRDANVLLIAENESEFEQLTAKKTELKSEILSKQIDAHIKIKRLLGSTPGQLTEPRNVATLTLPYGYEANGGVIEENLATADDQYAYYITHTWPGLIAGKYPTVPISVTAYEPYEQCVVWKYTTNESAHFKMVHDDENKYLYLVYAGHTVVLDKATGMIAGEIPFALGDKNFISEESLITVKKGDIFKLNMKTLRQEKICSAAEGAAMVRGKLQFVTKSIDGMLRNIMDLKSGMIEKQILYGRQQNPAFDPAPYQCIGIDSEGTVILWKEQGYGETFKGIKVYDIQNRAVRQTEVLGHSGSLHCAPLMALNETGRCNYVLIAELGGYSPIEVRTTAVDIRNGKSSATTVTANGYVPLGEPICSYERKGKAEFIFGGEWVYTLAGAIWSTPYHYTFTYSGGTITKSVSGALGLDSSEEFGTLAERLGVFIHGENRPNTGYLSVKIAGIPQSAEEEKAAFMGRYVGNDTIVGDVSTDADEIAATFEREVPVLKLNVSEPDEPAYISKKMKLLPSKKYYYEYDIKDLSEAQGRMQGEANVGFNTAKSSEKFGDTKYYVEKSFYEDFNDAQIDPYFTHQASVSGGAGGAFSVKGGSSSSTWREVTGTTTFTVPEGKRACISFDYKIAFGSRGWRSGVYINGERFINSDGGPGDTKTYTGQYTHPFLLNEGENTIMYDCIYYGSGSTSYFTTIDNLKVELLSETEPALQNSMAAEKSDYGWQHITGSFETPPDTMSYGSKPVTYNGNLVLNADTGTRNKYKYTLTVPNNFLSKTFAYPEGRGNRDVGPTVLLNGRTFSMGPSADRVERDKISSGEQIYMGVLSGTTTHTLSIAYDVYGSIPKFSQYLYENSPSTKSDQLFFSDDKKALFIKDETYTGNATFTLPVISEDVLIQNIKLYYIEGGKRIYLEDIEVESLADMTGWTSSGNVSLEMEYAAMGQKEERDIKTYKKGQLVKYGILYSDYENDPSKKQYWRYTHTPFNDGPHPDAAVILDEDENIAYSTDKILPLPIERFEVDGKYTAEHWQEDDTSRGTATSGNPDYDKLSNIETVTFYIEGIAMAPWITSISTEPEIVKEGDRFRIKVGMDDLEKDVLSLTTEVYKEKNRIYTHRQKDIAANAAGVYPFVYTDVLPDSAVVGTYEVICTVRDETGAGIATHRFLVISEAKITGWVNHTEAWEKNRKSYNVRIGAGEFDRTLSLGDYMVLKKPRGRGYNVFWAGERFMLEAAVEGDPIKVTAQILGEKYQTVMVGSGKKNDAGEMIYEGSLWDITMTNQWGRTAPEELTFRFIAEYAGGRTKEYDVNVIVDNEEDYWLLHRVW